jgi:hypothetical protein
MLSVAGLARFGWRLHASACWLTNRFGGGTSGASGGEIRLSLRADNVPLRQYDLGGFGFVMHGPRFGSQRLSFRRSSSSDRSGQQEASQSLRRYEHFASAGSAGVDFAPLRQEATFKIASGKLRRDRFRESHSQVRFGLHAVSLRVKSLGVKLVARTLRESGPVDPSADQRSSLWRTDSRFGRPMIASVNARRFGRRLAWCPRTIASAVRSRFGQGCINQLRGIARFGWRMPRFGLLRTSVHRRSLREVMVTRVTFGA